MRDELSAERRGLPWVKVEKQYVFAGPGGEETLADLFDGRSQLIVKHFMLAPGQRDPCVVARSRSTMSGAPSCISKITT